MFRKRGPKMTDDQHKPATPDADVTPDRTVNEDGLDVPETETDNMAEDADTVFPGMDENMLGQVQEMMAKLERADELEKENSDLKGRLARLAADFDSYRRRTQEDVAAAQGQGVSKAAEALMPVYDDMDRAVTMGAADPAKLIPGMQAVQGKILGVFSGLGLEATGREGEAFDPQWHEALQVVPGEQDDVIVQVYQLGFRMGDRLVRPARVVVSRKD
ncbi:nucleotide exchange factor GrpE [Deinococcus taeanensis]|uniref:nucleotide exchange factor GrpE n=1 Tax=Deinococcus taeanensis TaxID=2737050 RepID=UPI001CDBA441|nr:nucleotide exchange factor GrpE [Deinococcus taeanensis]UBV42265.1 nucleotide exchange factor GrpE [Deinococcus taeanensis]